MIRGLSIEDKELFDQYVDFCDNHDGNCTINGVECKYNYVENCCKQFIIDKKQYYNEN